MHSNTESILDNWLKNHHHKEQLKKSLIHRQFIKNKLWITIITAFICSIGLSAIYILIVLPIY